MTDTTNKLAQLLELLDVRPDELVQLLEAASQHATVAAYVTKARTKYRGRQAPNRAGNPLQREKGNTYRTLDTHWKRLEAAYGATPLRDFKTSDVEAFLGAAAAHAIASNAARAQRRQERGLPHERTDGLAAKRTALTALRAVLGLAVKDQVLRVDPSAGISVPKRSGKRRSLTDPELAQLLEVAASTGDDPELDYLLTLTHVETGARQGGPLELRVQDIDARNQYLTLREKGMVVRRQPCSRELAERLLTFARQRGSHQPADPVFRYATGSRNAGRPITSRRYDYLHRRWQRTLGWAGSEGVTSHWVRHSVISRVAAQAGDKVVAAKFAGHTDREVIDEYIHLPHDAVEAAISQVWGYRHPAVKRQAKD